MIENEGFNDFMIKFVFPWEGVHGLDGNYHEVPGDPGLGTKWGVCKRDYPDIDIKGLTMEAALQLYFREYWLKIGRQKSYCDSLPHPLNFAHLDCTINVGNWKRLPGGTPYFTGRANMLLQRALDVDDDGYIGPVTLAAVEHADPLRAVGAAIDQRDMYYLSRGAWADPFRKGWLNRTAALRKHLGLPPRDAELMAKKFEPLKQP